MLEMIQRSYKTRSIRTAQILKELINLVKIGEALSLIEDENAFYDVREIYHY